ncbi:MAG: gluconeogenesis factor YvcK family protein, partial [Gammaproteobacteria bacterium]
MVRQLNTPGRDALTDGLRVVSFGGGTGLGRTLASLRDLGDRLTGIVATTDDGGSTGWLREQSGGIAWGDVRNCLNQLSHQPTLGSLLLEYRFSDVGELSGHSLGNLILLALDQISPRPLHAIDLVRELVHVEARLMPMAEQPTRLHALDSEGVAVHGEVKVDALSLPPEKLWLEPSVSATPEAVNAILEADLITMGPGSFVTSVLPSLLVDGLREALLASK